jgi:hypothetical protein
MISQNTYIAQNAQDALAKNAAQQEERKKLLLRENQKRELKQLETKLYYKQQEVNRIKSQMDQIHREIVRTKSTTTETKNPQEVKNKIRKIEVHVLELEQNIKAKLDLISRRIENDKIKLELKNRELQSAIQEKNNNQNKLLNSQVEQELVQQKNIISQIGQQAMQKLSLIMQKISNNILIFKNKEKEIKILTNKIREFEFKINILKQEQDTLTQEQRNLEKEKNTLTSQVQKEKAQATHTISSLESKKNQENAQKIMRDKIAREIEAKIASLRQETDTLLREQENLEKEKLTLTSQVQKEKAQASQIIFSLESKMKQQQSFNLNTEKSIKDHEKVFAGLQQAYRAFSQEVLVLDNKIKALKASIK